MKRKQRVDEISKRLGRRKLLWFGLRGADATVLKDIPQFSQVFSLTAPLHATSQVSEKVCLETIQKRRVDIRTYNPSLDSSPGTQQLHRLLFSALGKPTDALTYRPDKFFFSAYFPQAEFVEYLGLFHERQAVFEDKAWVESQLRKCGIRTIPWNYYGAHNLPKLAHLLSKGRLVIRHPSSSIGGGVDMSVIGEPHELDIPATLPYDAIYAISPYLEPNIPLNVNACVFQDGTVSLHSPSLQLIGIKSCTNYPLSYCGNDFAQIRNLDADILNELETMTIEVGKRLAKMGYLGAFGIDAIEHGGRVYISEINARFQNSSVLSARLDKELDRPDMYLNHMAAFFGMPAPSYISLTELAKEQAKVSQIICYNSTHQGVPRGDTAALKCGKIDFTLLPAPGIDVAPDGMLFRAIVEDSVTVDGHSIFEVYESQVCDMKRSFSTTASK